MQIMLLDLRTPSSDTLRSSTVEHGTGWFLFAQRLVPAPLTPAHGFILISLDMGRSDLQMSKDGRIGQHMNMGINRQWHGNPGPRKNRYWWVSFETRKPDTHCAKHCLGMSHPSFMYAQTRLGGSYFLSEVSFHHHMYSQVYHPYENLDR